MPLRMSPAAINMLQTNAGMNPQPQMDPNMMAGIQAQIDALRKQQGPQQFMPNDPRSPLYSEGTG